MAARSPQCGQSSARTETLDADVHHPQPKAYMQFDEAVRMKPSAYYDRIVDVMEELVKFTVLLRDRQAFLVDLYSERKETAEQLMARVNQRSI